MWKRAIKGRELTFHLAGINNQNFLMRDEQTGSFWQQVSGRAISGPLQGSQLELVRSDELTSKLWRNESPDAMVLAPVGEYAKQYEKSDWESSVGKLHTVISVAPNSLHAREIVFGITDSIEARAYPQSIVLSQSPLVDTVGNEPIVFFVASDKVSVRSFSRMLNGSEAEFFKMSDGSIIDSKTQSKWNFKGCAESGALKGQCLDQISALKDYWFDWQNYYPKTTIYRQR